jgi:hypothetical protein
LFGWSENLFPSSPKKYLSSKKVAQIKGAPRIGQSNIFHILDSFRFMQHFIQSGESDIWDKCPQLIAAIQYLNDYAKKAFVLGHQCSFDIGGISSKMRCNPVGQ